MAQYRSQWTGEVIDDAVGKAKNITYLTIGVDAQGAFEKAEIAYGVAPIYAIKYGSDIQGNYYRTYRCYKKEDNSNTKRTYYFESYVLQSLEIYTLTRDGSNYAWSEATDLVLASWDDLEDYSQNSNIGIIQKESHATKNISKDKYVVFKGSLCTAITDISEGDSLNAVLAVPTHNLEKVQDGGLNDLKSALNTVDESIAIRVSGNKTTYASGAAIGQYVIVSGSTITGVSDGIYKAAKAIPYNTVIDSTYLTAVSGGAANDLRSALNDCAKAIAFTSETLEQMYNRFEANHYCLVSLSSGATNTLTGGETSGISGGYVVFEPAQKFAMFSIVNYASNKTWTGRISPSKTLEFVRSF